jgi:post-segregation antitoxin (ccd killing protein)
MTRVNIYLPRDLAERAKAAEINVSSVAQEALDHALRRADLMVWFEELASLGSLPDELRPERS